MTVLADFAGKTALVTGAGDGIGEMLARQFAASGLNVIVQDIRQEAAARVAREIGKQATPLVFDVSDREACVQAAEALEKQGTGINLLWINAGVGIGAPLIRAKPRDVEWAFSVNALGAIWTAQAFVPLLLQASGPRHLGITASTASLRSPEGPYPLYAMTKHASFAIGETLRAELAEEGIGTTILCPGLLNTNIWDGAKARPERFGGERHMDHAVGQMWREAKSPELMWPHIVSTIGEGGGYLVCATDEGDTLKAFRERSASIEAGLTEI